MVERYRRGKGKKRLLGSHQKCWIWGRNVVLETLRAGRWSIIELHLSDRLSISDLAYARSLAKTSETKVIVEPPENLRRLCHSAEHQGYLAKMPPFPYADAQQVLAQRSGQPLYVLLDSLQDPHNFGAVVRCTDGMGVDGVFVSMHGQAPVTSLVARTSAGSVNHVPIARVDDLLALAAQLKESGVQVVGTNPESSLPPDRCDLTLPTAIVIGSEGKGAQRSLLDMCDVEVGIRLFGHVASLNAVVSAGILLYEARRQRAAIQKS